MQLPTQQIKLMQHDMLRVLDTPKPSKHALRLAQGTGNPGINPMCQGIAEMSTPSKTFKTG